MIDQNSNNDDNLHWKEVLNDKGLNDKRRIELTILALVILLCIALIFQLISYISNIDFLAPFPGLNFIIIPICVAITFVVLYILDKTKYLVKVLNFISKLISWVKKYPIAYKFFRFIYKHPFISAVVVGIIWATVKNVVITI